MSGRCWISIAGPADAQVVTLEPKVPGDDLDQVAKAFHQHLLDFTLRARIDEETRPIREALVRTALAEAFPR